MADKFSKEACIKLLQDKAATLRAGGDKVYPKKSDFSETEVVAIKACFGPWPRALEAAGLKEPSTNTTHQHTVEKRIRLKRQRNIERKQQNIL